MTVPAESPFVALGIPPTLDLAAVKRAYFAALRNHPPHADPQGFKRLRAVYERLNTPDRLAAAFLEEPLDAEATLLTYRQRFDEALADAAKRITDTHREADQSRRVMEILLDLDLPEAVRLMD